MIPKPVYEFLPYLYLIAGSVIIASFPGIAFAAGILLYVFGSWLWLMRSEHRRVNVRQPEVAGSRFYCSPSLYEWLPFFYIFSGALVIGLLQHDVRFVMGPLIMATGVLVMAMRMSHRNKSPRPDRVVPSKQQHTTAALKRELAQVLAPKPALTRAIDSELAALLEIEAEKASNDDAIVDYDSPSTGCQTCQINDICGSVKLNIRSVQEIMRLSQTLAPTEAFELYREKVERIEGRRLSDDELRSVLNLLYSYSELCATWRRTGRLASR